MRRWPIGALGPGGDSSFVLLNDAACQSSRLEREFQRFLGFRLAKKLGSSCVAFDIVRKSDGELAVVEISYGFRFRGNCQDFWDSQLNWHDARFRPEYWMLDLVLSDLDRKEALVLSASSLEKD